MVNVAQRIRAYILEKGEASPYDVWKSLNRKVTYHTVVRYFNILEELGLIVLSREEPNSKGGFNKKYYKIASGKENHPCWDYPWPCYWDYKGREDRIPQSYRILGWYPWRVKENE